MTLSRPYRDTVVRRIQSDPEFAAALYAEALSSLVQGETATAFSMMHDLVHARDVTQMAARNNEGRHR